MNESKKEIMRPTDKALHNSWKKNKKPILAKDRIKWVSLGVSLHNEDAIEKPLNDTEDEVLLTTQKRKDEGYAWLIVFCSFLVHVLMAGIIYTVGVTFVIFLDVFQDSVGVTAWVGSLTRGCLNLIGPVSSMLTNRYGSRPVVILGGVISAVGLATSALASNIYHLYVTFGIITGVGIGMAYLPATTIINEYFDKKRTLAFGIATSGFGVGSFLYPLLIEGLNEKYGWRGMMLLLAGIELNICVCGVLMCPFGKIKLVKDSEKKGKVSRLKILKSVNFLILCFNYILCHFGISVVFTHLSEYSVLMGSGETESAMLFSVFGITNIVGLIMFGVIAHHPKVSSMLLYIGGLFLCGAATVFLPLLTYYSTLLAYSGFIGLFSATIGVLSPGIVCQILGPNELSNGYGVLMPCVAVGMLLGGPVAGFMYDISHTYNSSFFVSGGTLVISALCMVVPYLRKQNPAEIVLDDTEGKLAPLAEDEIKKSLG